MYLCKVYFTFAFETTTSRTMKTNYLLPHAFKKAGWILLIPLFVLFMWHGAHEIIWSYSDPSTYWIHMPSWLHNDMNTILIVGFSVAFLLVAFSREKIEDEYIMQVRYVCLIRSVIANYIVLIAAALLLYDFKFLSFMSYNMFTVILIYIIVFHISLYRLRKSIRHEN